ncbi:MAG: hypothetical protein M3R52_11345, partial [Acidobacteriota bacterium]|nr:hypothetical protein [Acidobacteriota bacterium]
SRSASKPVLGDAVGGGWAVADSLVGGAWLALLHEDSEIPATNINRITKFNFKILRSICDPDTNLKSAT